MSTFTKRDAKRHLRRLNPNPACHYCGIKLEWLRLPPNHPNANNGATADHIIPKSKGGTWHTGNLMVSCWPCNQAKKDKVMDLPTPEQARHYIRIFATHTIKGTDHVQFGNGDVIHFANMTDEEAVRVATGLMDIEAEAAKKGIHHAN